MKPLKSLNTKKYAWIIAYIDADYIGRVEEDLRRFPEFADIEAFIPTIKVLKKLHKGKNKFEEVPLLFNYGFFRVPRIYAVYPIYLESLQQNVACIIAWVKDPMKKLNLKAKQAKKKAKKPKGIPDKRIPVATATSEEISQLLKDSFQYSAHNATELNRIKPGEYIVLRGYPWEGIGAELVSIDANKEKAIVKLVMFDALKEVEVSFDNLFFTVYQREGYDDTITTKVSLENLEERGTLDKFQFKRYDKDKQ